MNLGKVDFLVYIYMKYSYLIYKSIIQIQL